MKAIALALTFLIFCVDDTFAQNVTGRYVVHKKDGSRLEGRIVEIYADSIAVLRMPDGTDVRIPMRDIRRIVNNSMLTYDQGTPYRTNANKRSDAIKFGMIHTNIEIKVRFAGGLGVAGVVGYRFNRLAHLGLGVGLDLMGIPVGYIPQNDLLDRNTMSGLSLPVYIHLEGELLDEYLTPYYAVEIGYLPQFHNFSVNGIQAGGAHGLHAGVTLGYRLKYNGIRGVILGVKSDFDCLNFRYRDLELNQSTGLYKFQDRNRLTSAVFVGICIINAF